MEDQLARVKAWRDGEAASPGSPKKEDDIISQAYEQVNVSVAQAYEFAVGWYNYVNVDFTATRKTTKKSNK